MKSNILIKGCAALACSVLATQAFAVPETSFNFEQQGGFANLVNLGGLATFTASVPTAPQGPGGYPVGTSELLEWTYGGSPVETPSSLSIATFSSDAALTDPTGGVSPSSGDFFGDVDGDGLWESGEFWTVTQFIHTNNIINGSSEPTWSADVLANLEIFTSGGAFITDDPGTTSIVFSETRNSAGGGNDPSLCTPTDTILSLCPDYFDTDVDLDTVEFVYNGYKYALDFGLTTIDPDLIIGPSPEAGFDVRVITPELEQNDCTAGDLDCNVSELEVTVAWSLIGRVPEPGTLALFGLGLAGLAFAGRRKKDMPK